MLIESPNIAKNPLVSIRSLAYNHGRYVEFYVRSVMAQKTTFEFELVISDDCSSDNTREVLLSLQKEFPDKLRLNFQEKNVGLIQNYKDALALCRSQYIAQCSCDDFWCDEKKLQKQVEALEQHPECDLCYTNCYTCDDAGRIDYTRMLDGVYDVTFEEHLVHAGYLAPLTWMIRREVVDYMDLQPWMTDESLAVPLDVLAKSKMLYLDEPTAVYRCHMGSAANPIDPKKNWRYLQGILKMQLYYAEKYKCSLDIVQRIKNQAYINYMLPAIEAGDDTFVTEAKTFFENQGLYLDKFYYDAKVYVDYHQKYTAIRKSRPYQLGKRILDPIKRLLKK